MDDQVVIVRAQPCSTPSERALSLGVFAPLLSLF
jgi:hypothetical protein